MLRRAMRWLAVPLIGAVVGVSLLPAGTPRARGQPASPFGQPTPLAGSSVARAVATGDLDGDGHRDIVLGEANEPSKVYLNDGQGSFGNRIDLINSGFDTQSVAVGDLDGDFDLDLVLANRLALSQVYFNDGFGRFDFPLDLPGSGYVTYGVTMGDLDGDGDLDLVLANEDTLIQLYYNNGGGSFTPAFVSSGYQFNRSVALGDLDGDGDLDLVTGGSGAPSQVYRNDGQGNLSFDRDLPFATGTTSAVAMSDLNGDGKRDIVLGSLDAPSQVYLNVGNATFPFPTELPSSDRGTTSVAVDDLDNDGDRDLVLGTSGPPSQVYLNDGLANFSPIDLAGSSGIGQAVELADLDNDGDRDLVLGRLFSSSQIFRNERQATTPGITARVVDSGGAPVTGAEVYALADDDGRPAQPLRDIATDELLVTDAEGMLPRKDSFVVGDQLVARKLMGTKPVAGDLDKLRFYQLSAAPVAQGLAPLTVATTGTQTLTLTNWLMLIDLDVSLEWDASGDTPLMETLRLDLAQVSARLYDWTDGQVALGTVTIYQNKERWFDSYDEAGKIVEKGADVRIYASNRMRPSASQGGIVTENTFDPLKAEVIYAPGEVRMGTIWTRTGSPAAGQGGGDWVRALAHELGHYALYLDDNYLGLDSDKRLISVEDCPGAMSDPYDAELDELRPDVDWLPACARTLSHQSTGRSDWATLRTLYNAQFAGVAGFSLSQPSKFNDNPGPSWLVLSLTTIEPKLDPAQQSRSAPSVNLSAPGGARYRPGRGARAFILRQGDASLIDLGEPVANTPLVARGLGRSDRLCVTDLARPDPQLGCAPGSATSLRLEARSGWQPDIRVSAITSATLGIDVLATSVALSTTDRLEAVLFPTDSNQAPVTTTLTLAGTSYSGSVELKEPATEGYVLVRVARSSTRLAVADYALGGSPAPRRRSNARNKRRAPLVSTDGQVVLYTDNVSFGQNQFFSLQTATRLPPDPPTARAIGQGYWLIGDPTTLQLLLARKASLNISYTPDDLVDLSEQTATIYFFPVGGTAWQKLPTTRNPDGFEATATVVGRGLYVVMASAVWNVGLPGLQRNIQYPGTTAPLPDALTPLEGSYSYVYGYNANAADNPWNVYVPGAPTWVNDLKQLEQGKRYHIRVSRALSAPYGPPVASVAATPAQEDFIPEPPALVYAVLSERDGLKPEAGKPVTARVGDTVCAETTTLEVAEGVGFVLDLPSASQVAGCGALGRSFTLTIGDYNWPTGVGWNNETVTRLGVRLVFLPALARQ